MRHATFLLPLAALVAVTPLAAQGTGTFAQRMLPFVEAEKPEGWTLRLDESDPDVIIFRTPGDEADGFINLARIAAICARVDGTACDDVSADFARKIFTAPTEFTRGDLRVIVRDQAYVDYFERELPADFERPPMRQVGDDLYAIMALDGPETVSLVRPSMLPGMGLAEDSAWELAIAQSMDAERAIPAGPTSGTFESDEFSYLSAMVSDLPRWSALAEASGPDFYMIAPSEQLVRFGTAPDSRLARIAAEAARECAEAQRCITPNVYRFRDGRWVIANR